MCLGWPCCLLAVNAPSALLCMPHFPELIGDFFVSENWSSWKHFPGPLEWQGVQGVKPLTADSLIASDLCWRQTPSSCRTKEGFWCWRWVVIWQLIPRTGDWVDLKWWMKCSQGGLGPKIKVVYHMEVTNYTCFAFGVRMCAYICIYALHTAISNCGNVHARIYTLIRIYS